MRKSWPLWRRSGSTVSVSELNRSKIRF